MMEFFYALMAGGFGAGGAYGAVWVHLKFHKGFIDDHDEKIEKLQEKCNDTSNRLTWLEAKQGERV